MKVVIMAGGLGKRLMPLTKILPKPLIPLGAKSVMEMTVEKLKEQEFNQIIIATNYKSEMFESHFSDGSKWDIKITYSKEEKRLGTAGPLALISEIREDDFIVINGDILTDLDHRDLLNFHKSNGSDLTVVSKEVTMPLEYGVIEHSNNEINQIREKPNIISEVNAGIYCLNPSVLKLIPNNFFHMTELIQELLLKQFKVMCYKHDGYWLDIGQMDNYEKAKDDIKEGLI